jgi:hypothetical protein
LRTNWQIQKIVRALATPFYEDALAALAAAQAQMDEVGG